MGNPWGNGSRDVRLHPLALEVQEGGFANKFAPPPVENNDDFIERQCLHFLLKKPPLELYLGRRFFVRHSFFRAPLPRIPLPKRTALPIF